jgi:blue copper oxidase
VSDLGWKDTALVWPGETVRVAIDFSHDYAGDQTYMAHCHNLEHEDAGMMINDRVTG